MTGAVVRQVLRRLGRRLGLQPATAFLGLGSNREDRLDHLRGALEELDAHDAVTVEVVSTIYETEPQLDEAGEEEASPDATARPEEATGHGPPPDPAADQPAYLNCVAAVTTTLSARQLLALAHDIEAAHGRDRPREGREGARPLDIDLLLYDNERIDSPELTVPHPRLTERPFVLVPLAEILPSGGRLPDGATPSQHLARLAPVTGVERYVRLTEGPGSRSDPLRRRPPGPAGGRPRLGPAQGGAEYEKGRADPFDRETRSRRPGG